MGDPPRSKGGTAVKGNVPVVEATRDEAVLPERVQESLGQLVGAAKEGLLALSVEVGLSVLRELLELEVGERVGRARRSGRGLAGRAPRVTDGPLRWLACRRLVRVGRFLVPAGEERPG